MKHIKTFRDKLKELEELKIIQKNLQKEIYEEFQNFVILIVKILDEILNKKDENILYVAIKTGDKKYFKIEHRKSGDHNSNHYFGIDTLLYYDKDKADLLWNLMGSSGNYEDVGNIFEYLINKYPKHYEIVLIKKDTKKYNL
jgi:hypothetical protein